MEEEAPSRRSVAELAGRFKGSAAPHDAAGQEAAKPVRRRPPRSLHLPKPPGDDQEPAGVTSPLPTKAKRNSALIEKLQANLALSPSALLPSPKSPGFRLLPPSFPPASPGSGPVTVGTSPSSGTPTSPLTEQEAPASFEAPPTVEEGSILSNANVKGRPRLSIRRRPPSRRHRKSSSGDEFSVANEGGDTSLKSPTEPEDKTREGDGGGEDQTDEGKDDKTDEGKDDETDEGKDDKTDEVKDDKTDEVKDDKTDEGKDDKTDEVKDDKTDEGKDDKTDEVKDDKTDEVKDDKTDEGKDDKTDEGKDDRTNPSPCPEKNESEEDHSETSVEPRQEVEKKEEENRPEGGKEEDGSSLGEKEEKKDSEEKQEDLTEGATNTDVTEEEKAEETTGQSSVR
ncbi:duboraya isoform X2 [Acanthopagrus latus]|uniref:duboraya isoform X2 n=1 Tax=Acanthopagrus latus TaxID=8177 RepID=UPI00187C16AB|nr:duboraya isoform X2 [Acanthopagrus latus]